MSTDSAVPTQVLLVDDDETVLHFVESVLAGDGCEVVSRSRAEDALVELDRHTFDLVITDVRMPGMSGLDLLRAIRRSHPDLPVVLATAHGSIDAAVEAMQAGATDYVTKPISPEDLRSKADRALKLRKLEVENRWLHEELAASYRPARVIAVSKKMRDVMAMVEKLASSDTTALVTGESGTGKELIARALHYGGARADGPFVAVNCTTLPAGLVESELFGHARGSFTGAVRDSAGKIELAHKGTLLLDEIGELPLDVQPKLLRALQEKAFERVGEHKLRRSDVRIVAATNRDLRALVEEGKFREDLYFRLAVVPIHVPPLRERPDDIPPLVRFFFRKAAGEEMPFLPDEVLSALKSRAYPGNVRELSNVVERIMALHDGGPIRLDEVPPAEGVGGSRRASSEAAPGASPATSAGGDDEVGGAPHLVTLPPKGAPLEQMVKDLVVQALERSSWNQSAAARMLRIPRHVLQYRIAKFGIEPPPRGGE